MGIIAVPDTEGRLRISELMAGSRSAQAAAVARLNQRGIEAAAPGDVLRAFTCTVFEFEARASLIGDLSGAKRTINFFGADNQPWEKAFGALAQGAVADGEVTIVLERAKEGTTGSFWSPLPIRMPAAMQAAEEEEAAFAAAARRADWLAASAGPSGRDDAPPEARPSPSEAAAQPSVVSALDRVLGQEAAMQPGAAAAATGAAAGRSSDELEWAASLRAESDRRAEEKREAEQEELERRRFRPEADDPGVNIALVGSLGTLALLLLAGFFP